MTQSSSKTYWLRRISALTNVSELLQQERQLKDLKKRSTHPARLWRASQPTSRSRRRSRYPHTAAGTVATRSTQTGAPAQPRRLSAPVAGLATTSPSAKARANQEPPNLKWRKPRTNLTQ